MFAWGKANSEKPSEYGIAEGNLDDKIEELGAVTPQIADDAEAVCWGLDQLGKQTPVNFATGPRFGGAS